jgi:hypothetical protein
LSYNLPQTEIDLAPKIEVGGRQWPVPQLAARQLRVILPRWREVAGIDYGTITTQQFDACVDVLHAAISRANPDVGREEILDLPITIYEILPALNIIAEQMGVLKKREVGEETNQGEALEAMAS